MAGPFGILGGMAGTRTLTCPHCNRRQLRAIPPRGQIECKFCHKKFAPTPARDTPKRR
jgi:hypothetical protein